jgi:glycosyltransferase|tara:strand:- start:459 stop:1211 length:753 start_codon:yes stop_codon:yes gene_type:complete
LKVTIITATYNSKKNIKTCLESVLNQTYKDIEIIIIDGNSNDNTLSVVNSMLLGYVNSKVISESDNGIYDALNKGLKLASGDIIGFVHSDDILYSPNIIYEIVDCFSNKSVDGVYGDLLYVNKSNLNHTIRAWKSCEFSYNLLKKGWMPPHPSLYLKREIYDKFGIFNLDYKISADYDFMLRVFKNTDNKFKYLPKVITKMRVGGASNRSLKNIIQKTREDYRAITSNNVGGWISILLKNLSKIKQFRIN